MAKISPEPRIYILLSSKSLGISFPNKVGFTSSLFVSDKTLLELMDL